MTFYEDEDILPSTENSFMFVLIDSKNFQIRRFNSNKYLAYSPKNYLSNFECGYFNLNMKCDSLIEKNQGDLIWTLTKYREGKIETHSVLN